MFWLKVILVGIFLSSVLLAGSSFFGYTDILSRIDFYALTVTGVTIFSLTLAVQGIFTLVWMLYAWESPKRAYQRRSPKDISNPRYSFSILLPARHEDNR